MLNFTYAEGRVGGQFNGRFAFRASDDASPLPIATFQALANGALETWADRVLMHEFCHWKTFRHSKLGIELIGRRYHARRAFARGQLRPIVEYYTARTCYFFISYQCHEDVVSEIENEIKKISPQQIAAITLKDRQKLALRQTDEEAQALIASFSVSRTAVGRLVDYLRGLIVTREYGLQSYFAGSGNGAILQETSMTGPTGGILNAAFDTLTPAKSKIVRIIKSIRRSMNIEHRTGTFTKERLALWCALKLQTEYATLTRIYSSDNSKDQRVGCAESYFHRYLSQTVDFLLRHTLEEPDSLRIKLLTARLLECAKKYRSSVPDRAVVENLNQLDHAFLYFFFCHGN